jgi:hypothetical protein
MKIVRFRWTESMKEDLMYILCDDNSVLCIQEIQSSLQRGEFNNVVKILGFMVKTAGAKMRQYTGRNRDKFHLFDEECNENKRMLRRALRDFKAKNDEESRIKYWVCRNRYAKILEHKRKVWQAKEVECINTVVRQKNIKKVWEEIRNIVIKREFVSKVNGQNILTSCFPVTQIDV